MGPKCPYVFLYEDSDVLVVYKKRDVFSIRTDDKKTITHNLYCYLKEYVQRQKEDLWVVHRLDYETSGVMIFAKNVSVRQRLQSCFEDRSVGRFYEAVVKEEVPAGKSYSIRQYLEEKGSAVFPGTPATGKEALTEIKAINPTDIGTALAIEIKTGRHNQIRLAIQAAGLSLLGDERYSHNAAKRMYLNCFKLTFPESAGLKQNVFETAPLWLHPGRTLPAK
jgi:23S rRNA pseudouridine1911/1915/1917 synthase